MPDQNVPELIEVFAERVGAAVRRHYNRTRRAPGYAVQAERDLARVWLERSDRNVRTIPPDFHEKLVGIIEDRIGRKWGWLACGGEGEEACDAVGALTTHAAKTSDALPKPKRAGSPGTLGGEEHRNLSQDWVEHGMEVYLNRRALLGSGPTGDRLYAMPEDMAAWLSTNAPAPRGTVMAWVEEALEEMYWDDDEFI